MIKQFLGCLLFSANGVELKKEELEGGKLWLVSNNYETQGERTKAIKSVSEQVKFGIGKKLIPLNRTDMNGTDMFLFYIDISKLSPQDLTLFNNVMDHGGGGKRRKTKRRKSSKRKSKRRKSSKRKVEDVVKKL